MEHGRVSGEGLILGESTVPLHRRRRSGFIDKKKEGKEKKLTRNESLGGDVNCYDPSSSENLEKSCR